MPGAKQTSEKYRGGFKFPAQNPDEGSLGHEGDGDIADVSGLLCMGLGARSLEAQDAK